MHELKSTLPQVFPEIHKIERIIVWLRKELRIDDNLSLWWACQDAREVIPLYIVDENNTELAANPFKRTMIARALESLQSELKKRGGKMIVRKGNPAQVLVQLLQETNAGAVYCTRDHDVRIQQSDFRIRSEVERAGKKWVEFQDRTLFDAERIITQSGKPYTVFTPYKKTFQSLKNEIPRPLPALKAIRVPDNLNGYGNPLTAAVFSSGKLPYFGGETEAGKHMKKFMRNNISRYHELRDIPGTDRTSRLSHHLALGTLGARTLFKNLNEAELSLQGIRKQGSQVFLSQLIWREFYYQILEHFPYVVNESFKREFDSLKWSSNTNHYSAWCEGMTGYPIVDAAMRQLNTEGWMHNRGRMIAASFLTKDLHIDWRKGEEYFMSRLIDGDVALNNGGWQWAAGTGTDAQPWFRIFNPVSQGKKFDSDGTYVKRYIPELSNVPLQYIHEPWMMPSQLQKSLGCIIGKNYPKPVIDHDTERKRALQLYRAIRSEKKN